MWRPRRIFWEEHGKWKPYPPKNTIQEILIRSKHILLSNGLSFKEKEGIKRFCKDFNVKTSPKERELCPFCLIHDKVSLLSSTNNYFVYDKEVCKSCAIQELENELKVKKINLLTSPGFKKYALSLLGKLQDTQRVSAVFTGDQASIGDLTLVQKIEKIPEQKLKPYVRKITEFPLPKFLLKSLQSRKIQIFLPIQVQALQKGLLDKRNQLIVANTSAGKTLIGEMAGISHVLENRKFIFTVPLVALANTKFEDFKKFYGAEFKIGLRTGQSRIFNSQAEKKAFYQVRYSIKDSDIIVSTYEGLDLLIRAGKVDFDTIGCIVIDEVQTLADPDRGPTLDCLLAKLRIYARKAQVIALSATIGNPVQFAKDLSLTLVTFDQRPIPLEKHILLSRSEYGKMRQILKLAQREYKMISNIGNRGQTIVFTNSRRKTVEIAESLRQAGVQNAHAYHSGLSNTLRKRIETKFSSGKCPIVVSTYALGAGVDFPASQVIFESLMMGNTVLDPNSFTQMVGRAGRLGKHDRGRVILLCLGESISFLDSRSEIEIAFELLNAEVLSIEPNHDENSCGEQILSICSATKYISPGKANEIYQRMIGTTNFDFMLVANKLIQNSFVRIVSKKNQRVLELTPLGRAATMSFFSPAKFMSIFSLFRQKKHFLSIALETNPPQNIYLSKKLHRYLEKTYNMRFSTRLINSPVLDVMNSSLKGKESTELNKWCLNVFSKWTQNFFDCDCPENPFCAHGQENIGRYIVNERLHRKSVIQISVSFNQFELLIYPGDILSFLNGLIHELEGIQRIAHVVKRTKLVKMINLLIDKIETPSSS
jgi:helicase